MSTKILLKINENEHVSLFKISFKILDISMVCCEKIFEIY